MTNAPKRQLPQLVDDPYLQPYLEVIARRRERARETEQRITGGRALTDFASGHEFYGFHRCEDGWVFREWAPNAEKIHVIGTFSDWREEDRFSMNRVSEAGAWELRLPHDAVRHGDLYRLRIHWPGGSGERIPAYTRRVVQDPQSNIFDAQLWAPDEPYHWRHPAPDAAAEAPLIYECHVGMAQEKEGIGTYDEFRRNVLPRIVDAGYNTLQMMAVMEHPYYGSFGYHVSSFFAASSRFGEPQDLKRLIDDAHGAGLAVVMDLVHSHAVMNEVEGLSSFDGTPYQYFHEGARGYHGAWDSRLFDYGKPEVLHFLLSNCRFWLDEYRFDGFRFDGVTSMLYHHHGLGTCFGSYDSYFDASVDEEAYAYLMLANKLVHQIKPQAVTIAEDVSGMPGLAAPVAQGGCGFDYRLAMGVPDCWFKLANDVPDEQWDIGHLWHELRNRRSEEKTISYVESHDQALVGGKSMIFELIDADMYHAMHKDAENINVARGMALHKMMRLATIASAGHGYLNFMGNEFGHPEWVDFPREGNEWSFHHARRQWGLRDDPGLKYHFLADFDRGMLGLVSQKRLLSRYEPELVKIHDDDKILVFRRGPLLFLFNWHPERSVTDYPIDVTPGEYVLIFDTDEGRFGGHSRLSPGQHYFTQPRPQDGTLHHQLQVYLPCRTGIVLEQQAAADEAAGA